MPEPPKEDFHVWLLDKDRKALHDFRFPYAKIARGRMRWYTLSLPSPEAPKRFYVALSFNPEQTKGIYLGLDKNVKESHSYVGLPEEGFEPVGDVSDWMVRVYLTPAAERAGEEQAEDAPWQSPRDAKLNDIQRRMRDVSQRQFSETLSPSPWRNLGPREKAAEEKKWLKELANPSENFRVMAISALTALKSKKAIPGLLQIASERKEKGNRDRWMACRALGIVGDMSVVPDLVQLTYHYNRDTRLWAQISLVRLTGKNFGRDVAAWSRWWDEQGGKPPVAEETVAWATSPETLKYADPKVMDELDRALVAGNGEPAANAPAKSAANFWETYRRWEGFSKGKYGVKKDAKEAKKCLAELVQGAYVATFRPAGGFAPKTPQEFLAAFAGDPALKSEPTGLGGGSFFRTRAKEGTLIGAFLTAHPDATRKAIEATPSVELISIEKLTPEVFIRYEASPQESLK